MTDFVPSSPVVVGVLGMHRSGTSAVAGMLHLLGVDLGRNLMKPAEDNPKGFWEHYEIVGCHISLLEVLNSYFDDILPLPDGWERRPEVQTHREHLKRLVQNEFAGKPLWGFKDPRACRLLPLWHPLLAELACSSRFVIVVRNPDEIALSMVSRGGHSYNQTLLVAVEHLLAAERNTRGKPRVVVSYDQLLLDWRAQARRIGTALGIQWPNSLDSIAAQAKDFLDPGLRHHMSLVAGTPQSAIAIRGADARIADWSFRGYQLLLGAAQDDGKIPEAALDQLANELSAARQSLGAWRPLRSSKDRLTKLRSWAAYLDDQVTRLTRENQELRSRLVR